MSLKVEMASREDLEGLRTLFYNERKKEFFWLKDEEIKLTDFDESTVDEKIYIVKINNILAGFASVYEADKFIHNLFVDSNFRKRGVGKALIEHILLDLGYPLRLKCVKKNINALNFYKNLGWLIEAENNEGEPYYLMVFNKEEKDEKE